MRTLTGKSKRYQLRLTAVALLAVVGLVAAGCGGSSRSSASQGGVAGASHTASSAAVTTRKLSGFGTVLVNAKTGHTIYVFMKDAQKHVTCTGSCASFWPPVKTSSMKPAVGGAAKSGLSASDKNPSGGRVATYNKWPLYTYSGDSGAGQSHGEGLNLSGGKWYVISAGGAVIKHKSSGGGGGGGTTTTGGGGWG